MTQPYETSAIDTGTVNDLLKRVAELEDQMQAHTGDAQGSAGQFYPHPIQMIDTAEFGGGRVRLDPLTMQVQVPDNTTGLNVISVVDQFQGTQAALDAHHPRIFYIVIRNGTSLTNQIQVNEDGTGYSDIDMVDHPGTEARITAGVKLGSIFGSWEMKITSTAAKVYPTDNVYLWLGGRTSDPTYTENGMIWYRDDLNTLYARINGVTTALGGGGGMKVQGSGYQVMPAAAAGVDPTNSGSAWTNGAWSQVLASTSEADYILGVTWNTSSLSAGASNSFEADIAIGTGGAGAETEVASLPVGWKIGSTSAATESLAVTTLLPYPLAVATSTRVAVRVRSSSTAQQPADIRLVYCKQTDLVSL